MRRDLVLFLGTRALEHAQDSDESDPIESQEMTTIVEMKTTRSFVDPIRRIFHTCLVTASGGLIMSGPILVRCCSISQANEDKSEMN